MDCNVGLALYILKTEEERKQKGIGKEGDDCVVKSSRFCIIGLKSMFNTDDSPWDLDEDIQSLQQQRQQNQQGQPQMKQGQVLQPVSPPQARSDISTEHRPGVHGSMSAGEWSVERFQVIFFIMCTHKQR